jgi:hypothetical protein
MRRRRESQLFGSGISPARRADRPNAAPSFHAILEYFGPSSLLSLPLLDDNRLYNRLHYLN